MAAPDEIRKLENAVRDAQAALTRARAENQCADEAWTKMVAQAEALCAQGKSVSAQFIVEAARRARADAGNVAPLVHRQHMHIIRLVKDT
jgi:hypothetical protein